MTPPQAQFVLGHTHLLCMGTCARTHLLCMAYTPPVYGRAPDLRKRAALLISHLHPTTTALCLVVSSHDVQGGQGNPDARCPRNHAKRESSRTTNDRDQHGRFLTNDGAERGRSDTNDGAEHGRSVLRVSSSSPTSGERSEAAS